MNPLLRVAWGVWALFAFAVGASLAVVALVFTPGLERRRHVARSCARGIFRSTGTAIIVNGLDRLPDTACIAVANHASYVDGVLMQAILPERFGFVVKKEILAVPVASFLLRRLGTEFVDRFNARGGAADAARLVRNSRAGHALAAFPEGTFHAEMGLRRFRMGVFYAAVRTGLPVVPVAIRGARTMLPAGRWLPHRTILEVWIGEPVWPSGRNREAAYALCDRVRAEIIRYCGEECAADRPL
jgi:1-acyl-sn-glycerol-3-phosphate acyltransferase